MIEDLMTRLPEMSTLLFEQGVSVLSAVVDWMALQWNDVVSMPEKSATLVLLALLTGALSKRISLLLGSLLLSMIAISSLVIQNPELACLAIACQALMILSAMGYRRHARRLSFAAQELRDEKDTLQKLLDREVRWRMASDNMPLSQGREDQNEPRLHPAALHRRIAD